MQKKLLYKEIMDTIKGKIQSGELKPNEMIASEIQLSEEFGVSRITAKKALNDLESEGVIYRIKGKGSFVSENAAQTAIKTANDLSGMNMIAFILPFESSLGSGMELIHGAGDYLEKKGYHLIVKNTSFDSAKEREMLLSLYKSNISGIVYYPFSERKNIDAIHTLILNDFPIVSIDRYIDDVPMTCIGSDNFSGAYLATSHLIERGHRNIAYVSDVGFETTNTVKSRFLGYCKALKDHSVDLDVELTNIGFVNDARENHPHVYEMLMKCLPLDRVCLDYFKGILNRFLDRNDPITAIHTLNDYVAMHIMKTALDMGLRIPEDLSIVGFDNNEIAQHLEVPLTTIDQDFYQLGYMAARILMKKMKGQQIDQHRVVLPVKLVERNSVCDFTEGNRKDAV